MAHLARKQFVGFLSLLALGDVKEDAEHDAIGYVRIVALTPSGYPADISSRQNSKINLVSTYDCARGGEGRPDPLKVSRVDILRQISKVMLLSSLRNLPEIICAPSSIVMASVSSVPRPRCNASRAGCRAKVLFMPDGHG